MGGGWGRVLDQSGYQDGQLANQRDVPGAPRTIQVSGKTLTLGYFEGQDATAAHFHGDVDELEVFATALDDHQIATHDCGR